MKTINNYTDFYNAEKLAKNYDAVISLGHFLPEQYREGKKYLFLDFEDETFSSIKTDPENAKFAPKENDVKKLVNFINELEPTDKLLIHCFAGYSRSSAAVAIAKCERDGLTLNEAIDELYDARVPDKLKPHPNDIILHNYIMLLK